MQNSTETPRTMATQYIQYCVGSERLSLAGRVLPGVPAAEESFLSAMNMKIGMQAMIDVPCTHSIAAKPGPGMQ